MKRKLSYVPAPRGAQCGRRNTIPVGMLSQFAKLHLRRLKWVDRDYDTGGCYWGGGSGDFIYWAYNDDGVELFVRAVNRGKAKDEVRKMIPHARFFN